MKPSEILNELALYPQRKSVQANYAIEAGSGHARHEAKCPFCKKINIEHDAGSPGEDVHCPHSLGTDGSDWHFKSKPYR